MFSFLCCCGARQKESNSNQQVVNENTQLIPPDPQTPAGTTTFDYARYEGRLGTIVRAKEGQMVNVNSSQAMFESTDDVDVDSLYDAYPEQEDMHAEGTSERSTSRTGARNVGLSARIVNDEEHPPKAAPSTSLALSVGSLSRSWGD